jgi:hypothetical protein
MPIPKAASATQSGEFDAEASEYPAPESAAAGSRRLLAPPGDQVDRVEPQLVDHPPGVTAVAFFRQILALHLDPRLVMSCTRSSSFIWGPDVASRQQRA